MLIALLCCHYIPDYPLSLHLQLRQTENPFDTTDFDQSVRERIAADAVQVEKASAVSGERPLCVVVAGVVGVDDCRTR